MRNRLRELLDRPSPAYGIKVDIPDPCVVELVGLAGFDFISVDLEHSGLGLERLEDLLRAAMAHSLGTIVRTPGPRSELIQRLVDLGIDGLLAPRVESKADVADLLAVTRFPPIGQRGAADYSRTSWYGTMAGDSRAEINHSQVIGVTIETASAVAEIRDIVGMDGLDIIFIGPNDLAASLGLGGQKDHPRVLDAIAEVIDAATVAGLPFALGAGHLTASPELRTRARDAVKLVMAARDTEILISGLRAVRPKGQQL